MKPLSRIFILVLLLTPFTIAQQFDATASNRFSQRSSSNIAADKAWSPFFTALRAAVQKRDRAALMRMMPSDFVYDCCDSYDANHNGDTRDEAFGQWSKRRFNGWAALGNVLAKGVVPESSRMSSNSSRPRRIAPPAANSNRYRNWIAEFEFRSDGRWYFISFQVPEND